MPSGLSASQWLLRLLFLATMFFTTLIWAHSGHADQDAPQPQAEERSKQPKPIATGPSRDLLEFLVDHPDMDDEQFDLLVSFAQRDSEDEDER